MEAASESQQITPWQKIGALMVALGPEHSAAVLSRLGPEEIESVARCIASMKQVESGFIESVLEEFRSEYESQNSTNGGVKYAELVLSRALKPEEANRMLEQLRSGHPQSRAANMPFLSGASVEQLSTLLAGQHLQTVAVVLAHIPAEKAAQVLAVLPPELQAEVARRIALSRPVPAELAAEIDRAMRDLAAATRQVKQRQGSQVLADMLSMIDRTTERGVLQALGPELAEAVRKHMFIFEDLPKLRDRDLQTVLQTANSQDLALALRAAPEQLQEHIFRNMSERAAVAIKEDMQLLERAKPREMEAAQQRICAIVRTMMSAGQLSLAEEADAESA